MMPRSERAAQEYADRTVYDLADIQSQLQTASQTLTALPARQRKRCLAAREGHLQEPGAGHRQVNMESSDTRLEPNRKRDSGASLVRAQNQKGARTWGLQGRFPWVYRASVSAEEFNRAILQLGTNDITVSGLGRVTSKRPLGNTSDDCRWPSERQMTSRSRS